MSTACGDDAVSYRAVPLRIRNAIVKFLVVLKNIRLLAVAIRILR